MSLLVECKSKIYQQGTYWQEHSRISWLIHGDHNTKFFHSMARVQQQRMTIPMLLDEHGHEYHDQAQMTAHCHSLYSHLFAIHVQHVESPLLLPELLPRVISLEDINPLLCMSTEMEVRRAVFSIGRLKAPGPDGFNAPCYLTYWDINKEIVV